MSSSNLTNEKTVVEKNRIISMVSNVQILAAGSIPALSRNDLTIGKAYRLTMEMRYLVGGTFSPSLKATNNSVTIDITNVDQNPTSNMVGIATSVSVFTAAASDLSIEVTGTLSNTCKLLGDTSILIEELNNTEIVSSF